MYRSVQVAEQEFDLHLSKLSYTAVLRACSVDGSEESAQFAIKIVAGMMVGHLCACSCRIRSHRLAAQG